MVLVTDTVAYLGLGANLGDAVATLHAAIDALKQSPNMQVLAVSSFYGSKPIGEGADGPNYTNAVAKISTQLSPEALLAAVQSIEQTHGRVRTYRNAPRTLDIDVLLYGQQIIQSDHLCVPHPRMHERAFVLFPLGEITPLLTWTAHDGNMQSLEQLLPLVQGQEIHRLTVS